MDFHARKLVFIDGPEGVTIALSEWHEFGADFLFEYSCAERTLPSSTRAGIPAISRREP